MRLKPLLNSSITDERIANFLPAGRRKNDEEGTNCWYQKRKTIKSKNTLLFLELVFRLYILVFIFLIFTFFSVFFSNLHFHIASFNILFVVFYFFVVLAGENGFFKIMYCSVEI